MLGSGQRPGRSSSEPPLAPRSWRPRRSLAAFLAGRSQPWKAFSLARRSTEPIGPEAGRERGRLADDVLLLWAEGSGVLSVGGVVPRES